MQGGSNVRAITAALVASMGAFLFGLDIGYIAPILDCASFKRDVAHLPDWEDPDSKIPSGTVGFIVAIFSLGCIASSLPCISSYFLDAWGRRSSIIIGSVVFLAGCVLQAEAASVPMMLVGRFVTGGAIGLLSSVVPLYQSEMAPASMRGAFASLYQLMITAGIFVSALVGTLWVQRRDGWRVVIWMQVIPALAIIAAMPCLPRSPRWLVQQGRLEEAADALSRIRGGKEESEQELKEIVQEQKLAQVAGRPLWSEVFSGRVGRLTALGSLLQLLQQLVGMNLFMYFGPRIFKDLGFSPNRFQTSSNLANFLATFPAIFLADRCGRQILLIAGALGMTGACLTMGFIGLCFMRLEGGMWKSTDDRVGPVMVAMVFAFVISFSCTWGPIVWVYCSEIFPLKYRARCIGFTTTVNWVGNFLIAQFSPFLLEALGFGTFLVFGAFSLAALALAVRIPETRGVSLEHMGEVFDALFGEERDRSQKEAIGAAGTGAASYGAVD